MVLRSIAILLVGTALGAGLQYGGALQRTSDPVDTNGIASTFKLHPESVVTANHARSPATVSVQAGGDNSRIDQIRRAHTAIPNSAVSDQPPTF
jgi:hypothetical protein